MIALRAPYVPQPVALPAAEGWLERDYARQIRPQEPQGNQELALNCTRLVSRAICR